MRTDGPIVAWVDASDERIQVVDFAIAEAKLRSVDVVMVTTIARPGLFILEGLQVDTDALLRHLRNQVETWSERVRDAGVKCEIVVDRGDEAETLRRVAVGCRASLVVVGAGTHVGSHLVHHAAGKLPCPAVIVPTP